VFEASFGRASWADHDGNVAAIGESLVGGGRWARSFAYLYIATGLGGGLVIVSARARRRTNLRAARDR
jgi:predicted NBD/HSP70 family sugar kinase